MGIIDFNDLYKNDIEVIINKLNLSNTLLNQVNKLEINPNKWIRLRKSNDKVELIVKHVYEKNSDKTQKVKEFEIVVFDLEETNNLLQKLGVVRRNYQEKIRYSYTYKSAEIEIDIWPQLEPYVEIECDDNEIIEEIINLLGYANKKLYH